MKNRRNRMKKIRILDIASALDTGGVERILYNYIK